MTDKSRGEFEAHIKKIYRYPLLERREQGFPFNGEYIESSREDKWRLWQAAWQASLAAIEIDMTRLTGPAESDCDFLDGYHQGAEEAINVIIESGLKVKGVSA